MARVDKRRSRRVRANKKTCSCNCAKPIRNKRSVRIKPGTRLRFRLEMEVVLLFILFDIKLAIGIIPRELSQIW